VSKDACKRKCVPGCASLMKDHLWRQRKSAHCRGMRFSPKMGPRDGIVRVCVTFLNTVLFKPRSRSGVVGIAARLRAEGSCVQIPIGKEIFFFSSKSSDQLRDPHSPLYIVHWEYFSACKAASPAPRTEVLYLCSPKYVFSG
jgi:hypothetical protein